MTSDEQGLMHNHAPASSTQTCFFSTVPDSEKHLHHLLSNCCCFFPIVLRVFLRLKYVKTFWSGFIDKA